MRFVLFGSIVLLGACAGAGTSGSAPGPPSRVLTSGDAIDVYLAPDNREARSVVPAPRERVWYALQAAYRELGITTATLDQPRWTLGNTEFSVSRSLGGRQLSFYLNCGSTLFGPRADHERIQLSIVSRIEEVDDDTVLRTAVRGTARSVQGTSSSPVTCASSGQLERRIAALVHESLGH